MKKLVNENLQEFMDNKFFGNIEIFKIQHNKKSDKRFSLISLNNVNEGENLFSFNNPITLSKYLYKEKLNEITMVVNPFTNKQFNSDDESLKLFLKIANILVKNKLINYDKEITKQLGKGGSNGHAFDLGDKVLKMTVDNREANNKMLLIGKKTNHLVRIEDMFVIKYFDELNEESDALYIYPIIEEKLIETGSYSLNDAASAEPMLMRFKEIKDLWEAGKNNNKEEQKKLFNEAMEKVLKTNNEKLINDRKLLLNIILEMGFYGVISSDYTEKDNLGKRTDETLVFFDIGGAPLLKKIEQADPKFIELRKKPKLKIGKNLI